MAKYEITYRCGHSGAVQIYGTNVHGERERKAQWLSENCDCPECRQRDKEAALIAAAEIAKANGMTEGTPKQMGWACKIIEETIKTVDAYTVSQAFQDRYANKVPALLAKGKDAARALMDEAIEEEASKLWTQSAKTIIDARFSLAQTFAASAARRLAWKL